MTDEPGCLDEVNRAGQSQAGGGRWFGSSSLGDRWLIHRTEAVGRESLFGGKLIFDHRHGKMLEANLVQNVHQIVGVKE